jgi:hypothetical protein
MQQTSTPQRLAFYRSLKTPLMLEEETGGVFTRGQWYTLNHRPERDPELASCIVRISAHRLLIDEDRLNEILESRRVTPEAGTAAACVRRLRGAR